MKHARWGTALPSLLLEFELMEYGDSDSVIHFPLELFPID